MHHDFGQRARWAAGFLAMTLTSACGLLDKPKPPTISEPTQSKESIHVGESVELQAVTEQELEGGEMPTLSWTTNFGSVLKGGSSGSSLRLVAKTTWFPAGCLTEGLVPTATLKVTLPSGLSATQTFTLTLQDYPPCTWTRTGDPLVERYKPSSVVLPSGKVLVVGGTGTFTNESDLYDPSTRQWTRVAPMLEPRATSAMVVLPSGKVLVASGRKSDNSGFLKSAELYDPASNTWTRTGDLWETNAEPSAIVLPSGKVLLTGNSRAELYDPSTGTWKPTMSMGGGVGHLVQLSSGAVLLVYDSDSPSNTTRLYAPNDDSWNTAPSMKVARQRFTVTPLLGGRILVTGGDAEGTAEIYDPIDGWSSTGRMTTPRYNHTATLLPSGKVLVTGGTTASTGGKVLSTSELYDPLTGTWSPAGAMEQFRSAHFAALLSSGEVLVTSGTTSELYRP